MICTMSKHAAEAKGCSDAMMMDYRGYVAEATGANVFFVKDGEVHTPEPDCFLNGITRQTVLEMLKEKGVRVNERHIEPHEMADFQQCWLTGTAAEVTPVGEIGPYGFEVGALTREIAGDYEKLVRGQLVTRLRRPAVRPSPPAAAPSLSPRGVKLSPDAVGCPPRRGRLRPRRTNRLRPAEAGTMNHRIIIDTDPGQDDAIAILTALASPEIEVLGICTVAGNVPLPLTTRNALKICELAGRTDVPVHAGAAAPLRRPLVTAEEVHGETGLERPGPAGAADAAARRSTPSTSSSRRCAASRRAR